MLKCYAEKNRQIFLHLNGENHDIPRESEFFIDEWLQISSANILTRCLRHAKKNKNKEDESREITDGERPQELLAILASTIVSSDEFNFLQFG